MAIGIAPSTSAIKSGKAFAGNSFKRLSQWFRAAGFPSSEAELREAIYFTSLNKCAVSPDTPANRKLLWSRCRNFLWQQIEVLKPELILLFGMEVAKSIFPVRRHSTINLGERYTSEEIFEQQLFSTTQSATWLLIPHPSGRNRAMNDDAVQRTVIASLKRELEQIGFLGAEGRD